MTTPHVYLFLQCLCFLFGPSYIYILHCLLVYIVYIVTVVSPALPCVRLVMPVQQKRDVNGS